MLPSDRVRGHTGRFLTINSETLQVSAGSGYGRICVNWGYGRICHRRTIRSGRTHMKRTLSVLVIAGVALVAGARVQAHHSFAATYFEDQTEPIEGNAAQFLFRNPH